MFVYFSLFLVLFMTYGYCLTVSCITIDLIGLSFKKMAHREKVFRKPSLPNEIKAHQALIHCSYLDTFVLDGRDGNPGTELKLLNIYKNYGKSYHTALTSLGSCSRKLIDIVINPGYYIILLGLAESLLIQPRQSVCQSVTKVLIHPAISFL